MTDLLVDMHVLNWDLEISSKILNPMSQKGIDLAAKALSPNTSTTILKQTPTFSIEVHSFVN